MLEGSTERVDLAKALKELTTPVGDLEEGLLVSAIYDGDKRLAVLKLYDPKLDRFWLWEDNTGHRPYCYTKLPAERLGEVRSRKDVVEIVDEQKLDLLSDSKIMVRKIVATDPLAIGGSAGKSIRDIIEAWEADIKYYENYAYDRGLRMGTYYRVLEGQLQQVEKEVPESVKRSLDAILSRASGEEVSYIKAWADLLGQPLATFKRIACDIEVANEEGRIPDPEKAEQEVIAVSFYNEKESLVYLFQRNGADASLEGANPSYKPLVYPDEGQMLRAVFAKMLEYPFLLTFNGDDFDLRYLKHRAEKRWGIREEEIPIALQRQEASLKHGVHIDLYRFFNNRSIQVYIYNNRYSEHTLNGISEALIDKSKLEFEGNIGDLPLLQLANYCLNDSQLTYELTSVNDSLLMKILLVISRIAKMPMNDAARLGVSNWIRSMLFNEHRRMGALIPRQEELKEKGGASSDAIIKGKKYKGGLVIEPTPGIHFGVSVLDFASLYPSIIKVHNLSYETVNCGHEECKANRVPDTEHWVCTKRSGIESLTVGSLRDLRVGHYKPLSKDKSLAPQDRELYNTVTQGLKVFLNACFTGDTLVVTPTGLKNVKNVMVGDRVVNVSPETLEVEFDRVVQVQAFPFSGELFHFRDNGFVDLMVTPNHRFLVRGGRGASGTRASLVSAEELSEIDDIEIPKVRPLRAADAGRTVSLLSTASELGGRAYLCPADGARLTDLFRTLPHELSSRIRARGRATRYVACADPSGSGNDWPSHYVVPASVISEADADLVERAGGRVFVGHGDSDKVPMRQDARALASLCGRFVSECCRKRARRDEYPNGAGGAMEVAVLSRSAGGQDLTPAGQTARFEDPATRLGSAVTNPVHDSKTSRVANSILESWVLTHCLDSSGKDEPRSPRVPRFVFQSREAMDAFLAAACGSGRGRKATRFSTESFGLAEDMLVLLSCLGAKTKLSYDDDPGIYSISFENTSCRLTSSGAERGRFISRVPYEGTVYCVTTEKNHTVIAGRNGRFVPVGQSYGVMGFETFALYCLPVADATAAFGRDAITKTIEKCKREGIPVIYSDTDSLFIENPDKEKVSRVVKWADEELGVELDVDKLYRYVAFSERKKNYFGVLQDGTADIKGLTGKKSQTPDFLKKTFYEALGILGKVYRTEDFEHARTEIKALLTKTVEKLRNKEYPLEELAFNVMIGKALSGFSGTTPQHVKAAKLLQDRGKEIKAGDIISFVKTKTPPYVKPVNLARVEEVDVDKYLEYASSMFDQMLDAMGFSFDEIMGSTTLDAFWS